MNRIQILQHRTMRIIYKSLLDYLPTWQWIDFLWNRLFWKQQKDRWYMICFFRIYPTTGLHYDKKMFTASILPQFIDWCEIQVLRSPPRRIDPRLLPNFLLVFCVRTHLYLLSDANSEKLFRKNSHLFTISKECI